MLIYTLIYRFCSGKNDPYCNFNFSQAFYHLYSSICNLIDLFFGIPKYNNRDLDFDFFNVDSKNKLKKFDEIFELKQSQEIFHSLMNNNNQKTINNIRNIKLQEYFKFLYGYEDFIEFERSHLISKDYLILNK